VIYKNGLKGTRLDFMSEKPLGFEDLHEELELALKKYDARKESLCQDFPELSYIKS